MKILLALLAVCANCVNIKCNRCNGKGYIVNPRLNFHSSNQRQRVACPDCFKGLYKASGKGEGKIFRPCEKCSKKAVDKK